MVTGVTDIYIDSGCNRATDPDFGSSLDLNGIIVTHVGMTHGVACPLDTSMAKGSSSPEVGHPCNFWWQLGLWTSTQTPSAVGPWIQTWCLAAPQAQMPPCPQVTAQVTQISIAWLQGGPWTTWLQVAAQTPGICMAFNGTRSNRYQPRPWLQSGHGPRNGLRLQLRPDITMPLGGCAGHSDLNDPWGTLLFGTRC